MSDNKKTKKVEKQKDITKWIDSTVKRRKLFNLIIIALAFVGFAIILIGSFNVDASKYAIGFGILPILAAVGLAIFRFYVIFKAGQFDKKEMIWHIIALVTVVLTLIFWIWALAESVANFDALKKALDVARNVNSKAELVVIRDGATISQSLVASLYLVLITSVGFLFTQTLYNTFVRVPNQL